MDMPKPGREHARLARFAGRWSGEETLYPSPWGPGGKARARSSLKMSVGGLVLVHEYEEEIEGQVSFRGHGVFMVDPATSEVIWWWFDSIGFPPEPARGRWESEEVLRLRKTTARGEARYEFRLGEDDYDFRIETLLPGQSEVTVFMEGHYRRER